MKHILLPILSATLCFASLNEIHSFKADFTQSVTDDKNATLSYNGYIQAQKPQNALWNYTKPIEKNVYISRFNITVVEPELEQVIIRKIESNFDFFRMIRDAKKIDANTYEAHYKNAKFIIKTENKLIQSIIYKDEFENDVVISFTNQKQNIKIDKGVFIAEYPNDYDVIGD